MSQIHGWSSRGEAELHWADAEGALHPGHHREAPGLSAFSELSVAVPELEVASASRYRSRSSHLSPRSHV